jgi:hypothetical protein
LASLICRARVGLANDGTCLGWQGSIRGLCSFGGSADNLQFTA